MMAQARGAGRKANEAARWLLRAALPRTWRQPLRVWGAQHGEATFQDIVTEALQEWAKRRGVELPPMS